MKKLFKALTILCLVFAVAGCGTSGPQKIADKYLKAMTALDYVSVNDCMADGTSDIEDLVESNLTELSQNDLATTIYNYLKDSIAKMKYTIGETKIDGDSATVAVHVEYCDISDVLEASIKEYLTKALTIETSGTAYTEEQYGQLFKEIFAEKCGSETVGTLTKDIVLDCVKKDNEWKIDALSSENESAMSDILTCNMIEGLEDGVRGFAQQFN